MDDAHFALLADRHRKVLRLYGQRYRMKEIAQKLSLSENSVNTYLTEAVHILGAGGRRAAADALLQREPPYQIPRYQPSAGAPGDQHPQSNEPQRQQDSLSQKGRLLPLRSKDGAPNRLSVYTRLVWMTVMLLSLTIGVAVAIALYAVYVKPMEQLFR